MCDELIQTEEQLLCEPRPQPEPEKRAGPGPNENMIGNLDRICQFLLAMLISN